MIKIEKLSEKNLGDLLSEMFPDATLFPQKRIKVNRKTLIIDYEIVLPSARVIYIEFDGPTHYTLTKTQVRDLSLAKHCLENDIKLVRIPYFYQINPRTVYVLFGEELVNQYSLNSKIDADYTCGFIDKTCTLPGDFNQFGWELFYNQYLNLAMNDYANMDADNLRIAALLRDKTEFLGVSKDHTKEEFWTRSIVQCCRSSTSQ